MSDGDKVVMRNCPICGSPLTRVDYEGFAVLRCDKCRGHLVDLSRVEAIKRTTGKSQEELKTEATTEFHGSNKGLVKCPRCHVPMRKQPVTLPGLAMETDFCRACSLVWFDGGELALAQLGYEATPGFADVQEMKRRMTELEASPARKAAFEKNLAALPEPRSPLAEAMEESAADVLESILRNSIRI
jgi:Zn-finger nucleic acid-binding protein